MQMVPNNEWTEDVGPSFISRLIDEYFNHFILIKQCCTFPSMEDTIQNNEEKAHEPTWLLTLLT